MTRAQHEVTKALTHVEGEWLKAYHWHQTRPDRWTHVKAPDTHIDYSLRDAVNMTRADLLRYGSSIRSVG